MSRAELGHEEWVMLETVARPVERRIATQHEGAVPMPLGAEGDRLGKIAAKASLAPGTERAGSAVTMKKRANERVPPPERLAIEEASTVDLVKEALDEAKELVRLEVELAKAEIDEELTRAKRAAVGFALAAAFGVLALCMFAVALVLALGGTALTAVAIAGAFLLLAGLGVALGYSVFPKKPLGHTRERLESDLKQLKEHLA